MHLVEKIFPLTVVSFRIYVYENFEFRRKHLVYKMYLPISYSEF